MRKAYNIIICDMRSSVFHFRRCVLRVSSQKVLLSCTFCSWLPNKSTIIPKKRGCILALSKYGIEIWGELLGTKQSFFETSSHGCGAGTGTRNSIVARASRSRHAGALSFVMKLGMWVSGLRWWTLIFQASLENGVSPACGSEHISDSKSSRGLAIGGSDWIRVLMYVTC